MVTNVKKLQYIPYGTAEHRAYVKKIQRDLFYKDYVVCMEGKFSPERNKMADDDINRLKMDVDHIAIDSVFPGKKDTVYSSKNFFFIHRNKAEYNLDYRQVNVGILLVDDNDKTVVLKKNNGFLSLIGGHTDFNKDSYGKTVEEVMHTNMVKEFKEELKTDLSPDLIPPEPLFFITEGKDMWDFYHCWFIYLVPVDDVTKYKFESGEPDKHSVEIVDIREMLKNVGGVKIKNSLKRSIDMYSDLLNSPVVEPVSNMKVEKREPVGSHAFKTK